MDRWGDGKGIQLRGSLGQEYNRALITPVLSFAAAARMHIPTDTDRTELTGKLDSESVCLSRQALNCIDLCVLLSYIPGLTDE